MPHNADNTPNFWKKKTFVSYLLSILVFWIHCSAFENYENLPDGVLAIWDLCQNRLTPVAVPLFFVMSGAVFFRNLTPEAVAPKLKRRVRSLVVPYLSWNTLNMLFSAGVTLVLARFLSGREPFAATPGNLLGGVFLFRYNAPFWFIFMLILFTAASPLLEVCTRRLWAAILTTLAAAMLTNWDMPLVWVRTGFTCLTYYLCGALLGRYAWRWFAETSERPRQLAGAVTMVALGLFLDQADHRGLYILPALRALLFAAEGLGLWFAADVFFQNRDFRVPRFMDHSFLVYALHINVSAIVTKVIYLAAPKTPAMAVANFFLTTVATLALIELFCIIMQKCFPRIFRILSGNR